MITFSIITVTYNAADVLQPTLDSVLTQNYKHVEHLIVDGASKDSTVAMTEAYKRQSDSCDNEHVIRIQSEPDKGLYDAMNKGLRMATGDYVVFLNAGDRLPDVETLEHVAIEAETGDGEERPGVLYGDTDLIDAKGRFVRHRRLQPPAKLTWKSFRRGMLVCHQAFYARRDIATMFPYDLQYRHSADVDWCIKVMHECHRQGLSLHRVPRVVALFLTGGDTTKNHRASLAERFRVMAHHYGFVPTAFFHLWFAVRSIFKK